MTAASASSGPSTSLPTPSDLKTSNDAKQSKPKQPKNKMRGRPDDSPDVQLSKTLSYILRHGAAKEGLTMRKDGFIRLDDILKRPKLKGVDVATVERIVAENAKQRFALASEAGPDGVDVLWIRANQGHSVQVEDLQLEPLTTVAELPVVVHGTQAKLWPTISEEGLKVMTRTHIHCASGLFGEEGVISGMRASCNLFIYLDVAKCLQDGITFFRSTNGVILTAGLPQERRIPKQYFAKVQGKDGNVLYSNTDGSVA